MRTTRTTSKVPGRRGGAAAGRAEPAVVPKGPAAREAAKPGGIGPPRTVLGSPSRPTQAAALLAERYLLHHFGPPAVAVARDGQVVRFFGDVKRYVRVNDRGTSLDLLDLVRPPLRPALRAAWQAATAHPAQASRQVERREVLLGRSSRVGITLRHLSGGAANGLWLVVFAELPAEPAPPDAVAHLNQRLERRIAERTAWLTLLRDIATAISDSPTSTEALQVVLRQLCVSQEWQLGFLYQPEPESGLLVPTVSHIDGTQRGLRAFHDLAWRQRYARGDALPGEVYADATPVWIDDADVLAHRIPIRGRALKGARLRAAALLPVLIGRQVVAVVELFSTSAHVPAEEHAMLLADVCGQLAKVLERERATEEMSEFVWREQQELLQTLHDSLGQTLTGLGMLSAGLSLRLMVTDPPAVETAQQIVRQAQLALEDVRKVSKGLSPVDIDAAGFPLALRQLAATTSSLHGIPIDVADDLGTPIRDGRVATQLYRIAQEAVTNAVKHARASRIRIRYAARHGRVTLTIADNGVGIPCERPDGAGLGLRIMRHRASTIGATLNVAAGDTGGTEVSCTVRERPNASAAAD